MPNTEFTIAAIQAAPVYFDRDASTDKACRLIGEAGESGVSLATFSETWLPGYPFFCREPVHGALKAEYLACSVIIPSPTTDRLCEAAQSAGIDVVIGVAELDATTQGTTYCTLLFISREGRIIGRHRKLKPTDAERRVWGEGDGTGLTVHERPYGRISGLNCWEHIMVLPGYALMAQGTQIHIAAWPFSSTLDDEYGSGVVLSRAFARQGGCYVIATCALLSPDDVPDHHRDRALARQERSKGDQGGCLIIGPTGKVLAKADHGQEMILKATVSLDAVREARGMADVGGHYSRPDVLQLSINRRPLRRYVETGLTESTLDWSDSIDEPPSAHSDVEPS